MSVAWPATVPLAVLEDGYAEAPGENTIRTPMDTGPAKVRRRATSAPRRCAWRQVMTAAELADFVTFFETTAAYGSIAFTRRHPRTGSDSLMRFLSPPSWAAMGKRWNVSISVEVLA